MTDLAIGVRLKADSSGFVGQIASAQAEIKKVGAAGTAAASGARALQSASSDAARSLTQTSAAAQAQKQAMDALAKAKARAMNSTRMLGVQVNDFGTQISTGSSVAQAFAAQIGQMGFAMDGMGGKLGAVGRVLQGPWGAAIALATMGLGSLIGQLMGANKETKKKEDLDLASASAMDRAKASTEELIDAIRRENEALGKLNRTQEENENIRANSAIAAANDLVERRKAIVALLDETKALSRRADAQASQYGADTGAAIGAAMLAKKVSNIDADIRVANEGVAKAQDSVRLALLPIIRRHSREQADPSEAIKGRFRRQITALEQTFDGTIASGHVIARKRAEILKQQDRELDAARESTRKPRKAATANGRDLDVEGDVDARLRGIGARVTSGYRSREHNRRVGGALNSYHITGQARDIAKTAGVTMATIRGALNGLDIKELIDEGDHFHVAWGGALRGVSKEAKDAAAEARELDTWVDQLTKRFAPGASAAATFAEELKKIAELEGNPLSGKSGRISMADGLVFRMGAARQFQEAQAREREELSNQILGDDDWKQRQAAYFQRLGDDFAEDNRLAGREYRDELKRAAEDMQFAMTDLASSFANLVGGKMGRKVQTLLGLVNGAATGNFRGVSGPLGGFLQTFSDAAGRDDKLGAALKKGLTPLTKGLDGVLGKLGTSVKGLAGAMPAISAGLALQSAVGSLLGNDQIKGANGPLGMLVGPIGMALFGKAKKGSASISSVDGKISTRGNSKSREAAAEGIAGNVQGMLEQIADAFGGSTGNFAVSIGMRKKKYVVDPEGKGRTKGSGVQKFDDEEAARSAALRNALADGAVIGLSAAVSKALGSNSDLNKSIREALKVDEVETLLAGPGAAFAKVFRDFERQAADRVRIAKQYGFELVKLEERNAQDRAKIFDDLLSSRVGGLKSLLNDLNFGDLFAGSLVDQRKALLGEIAKAETDARSGVDGAADKVANLRRKLLDVSLEANGTAGAEYAADRSTTRSAIEDIIKLENERVKAAQDAALGTKAAVEKTNELVDETNGILAQVLAEVRRGGTIGPATSPRGGGGGGGGFSTVRQVQL